MATVLTEAEELAEEFSQEELQFARRLRNQSQQRKIDPYVQNLRDRMRYRNDKDKPPLIEGKYRSYVVLAGTHTRWNPEDKKHTDKINAEGRQQYGDKFQLVNPQEDVFRPGDKVTPLEDNEALMMAQDPGKFRWTGANSSPADQVDEILAEQTRLKQLESSLAAREEELRKREEEVEGKRGKRGQ